MKALKVCFCILVEVKTLAFLDTAYEYMKQFFHRNGRIKSVMSSRLHQDALDREVNRATKNHLN